MDFESSGPTPNGSQQKKYPGGRECIQKQTFRPTNSYINVFQGQLILSNVVGRRKNLKCVQELYIKPQLNFNMFNS